jgi:hypothetical protein
LPCPGCRGRPSMPAPRSPSRCHSSSAGTRHSGELRHSDGRRPPRPGHVYDVTPIPPQAIPWTRSRERALSTGSGPAAPGARSPSDPLAIHRPVPERLSLASRAYATWLGAGVYVLALDAENRRPTAKSVQAGRPRRWGTPPQGAAIEADRAGKGALSVQRVVYVRSSSYRDRHVIAGG